MHLAAGAALCAVLVLGGLVWRETLRSGAAAPAGQPAVLNLPAQLMPTLHNPFIELLKLISAFLIGLAITAVHRATSDHRLSSSMEQAQILLCVSGALMMVIIGDSLARAFGIAGAASIIRFRTPVDDPKDTIILFLALGMGMACGLGAFAVAGLGTAFLGVVLWYLARAVQGDRRSMVVTLMAEGEYPTAMVHTIFERHGIEYETRGITEGEMPQVKYMLDIAPGISLDQLSEELRGTEGSNIKSVTWEKAKKKG
ncbi:MAG: DUF4956 domain-containing protein [Acidimicrobiia bacterium]|nr:DUF4956 domain-containing protein [Acidimicrobiia bacterium]